MQCMEALIKGTLNKGHLNLSKDTWSCPGHLDGSNNPNMSAILHCSVTSTPFNSSCTHADRYTYGSLTLSPRYKLSSWC